MIGVADLKDGSATINKVYDIYLRYLPTISTYDIYLPYSVEKSDLFLIDKLCDRQFNRRNIRSSLDSSTLQNGKQAHEDPC